MRAKAAGSPFLYTPYVAIMAAIFGRRVAPGWRASFEGGRHDESKFTGVCYAMVICAIAVAISLWSIGLLHGDAMDAMPALMQFVAVGLVALGMRRLGDGDGRATAIVMAMFLLQLAWFTAIGSMSALGMSATEVLLPIATLVAGAFVVQFIARRSGASEDDDVRFQAMTLNVALFFVGAVVMLLVKPTMAGTALFAETPSEIVDWANGA